MPKRELFARPKASHRKGLLAGNLSLLVFLGSACSGSGPPNGSGNGDEEGVATPCQRNSDCAEWEACFDGLCGPECLENRDCPEGEKCWGAELGCWPEGIEPVKGGPRDIEVSGPGDVEFTIVGCTLAMDCEPGHECVAGQCKPVEDGAPCTWDPNQPLTGGLVFYLAGEKAGWYGAGPAHNPGRHVICDSHEPTYEPADRNVIVSEYSTRGIHTIEFNVGLKDPWDPGLSCDAVAATGSGYVAIVGNGPERQAWYVDDVGEVLNQTSFPLVSGVSQYTGKINFSQNAATFTTHGSSKSRIYKGGLEAGANWRLLFDIANDAGLPFVVFAPGICTTHAGIDGVNCQSYEQIVEANRGVGLHIRKDGDLGWFSVDAEGELFYSIGTPGGEWQTESTSHVNREALVDNRRWLQFDVASHPISGEPLFAYLLPEGEYPVFYLVRSSGAWMHSTTTLDTEFGETLYHVLHHSTDLNARWVGCGRPSVALGGGGLIFLEAR